MLICAKSKDDCASKLPCRTCKETKMKKINSVAFKLEQMYPCLAGNTLQTISTSKCIFKNAQRPQYVFLRESVAVVRAVVTKIYRSGSVERRQM